jgi:FlaA1/EpsC-like NDP-sugar epimerase
MDRSPTSSSPKTSGASSSLVSRVGRRAASLLPRVLIVVHDVGMVWVCWVGLTILRYRFVPGHFEVMLFSPSVALVLGVQGLIFWWAGLYRGLWRFASLPDLINIAKASVLGLLAIVVGMFMINRLDMVPRSALVLYPIVLIVLVGGPRLLYRGWKDRLTVLDPEHADNRVLILGAGRAGEALVRDMIRDRRYLPVGFLDDDVRLRGAKVHGVPVLGTFDELVEMARETNARLIVIAIPTAATAQMQRAVALCDDTGLPFRTVPRLHVLVTGAGGSIGSELCRQVASLGASSLTLVEQTEYALVKIHEELGRIAPSLKVHCVLGDCGDRAVIRHALQLGNAQAVLHAAAYKQVPVLEGQVREAVRNNVLATQTVAEASVAAAVDTFLLISTDKAVDPVNVLGASKRLAEMACHAIGSHAQTRIVVVRFGNVLDSAGSVVPVFREQIRCGGPVTVTHPEVSRYFMTIPEACQLILQAAAIGTDQAIFTLDMGEPVPIRVLAEQMIRLAGKVPGRDVQIVYTGLRPGEKIHETLYHPDECNRRTAHPKILQAESRSVDIQNCQRILSALRIAVADYDQPRLHRQLREAIPEYKPVDSTVIVQLPIGRRSVAT